ncbi:uncharacterized protein LOC111697072 isoform X2 [Eurytemora carolleeae]|uniref:uncharacterized protein LOC111697072 isoform X2 n=1 Tax=Eurytemora carolleeae TaxID=1294199 RepID=UPI000C77B47E|nr:uncharacterized protein LOC111697072 isoform X2 [Eurytemora carolleeae]|eukprot:XP_023322716.1 uncharacterized protein LOC111697072 isoform X2 [Eurytemora affinis]
MSISLSRGSLLRVFSNIRVYQPVWQVLHVYQPDRPIQLVISDGEYTTNSVTLKPSCQLTYDKTEWKKQNSKRSQEDVLLFYKHPVLKIIDFEIATSQSTSIILLSKIKLMGWERTKDTPEILRMENISLVTPRGKSYIIQSKPRYDIEDWERPRFQFTEREDGLDSLCLYNDPFSRIDMNGEGVMERRKRNNKTYTEQDLLTGDLAVFGPNFLDVLTVCGKCKLLNYQTLSRTASFTPPTRNFVEELNSLDILKNKDKLYFCTCDDENEKFREEFQSKCIVVNQESSPSGKSNKVQCILIGKNKESPTNQIEAKMKSLTNEKPGKCLSYDEKPGFKKCGVLPQHKTRAVQYSASATVCERCGVEDTNMGSCRLCQKVFYCSPPCKRADVKDHSSVCRAYITVRRYTEDRESWAAKLRESENE